MIIVRRGLNIKREVVESFGSCIVFILSIVLMHGSQSIVRNVAGFRLDNDNHVIEIQQITALQEGKRMCAELIQYSIIIVWHEEK